MLLCQPSGAFLTSEVGKSLGNSGPSVFLGNTRLTLGVSQRKVPRQGRPLPWVKGTWK